MSGFGSKRKERFLGALPSASLEGDGDLLTEKCKFNFAYFTVQSAGQNFDDWEGDDLCKLFHCLKEYSKFTLDHWSREGVLKIYRDFPKNSEFTHPPYIPHEVWWGRFRLASAVRLAGFVVPGAFHGKEHPKTKRLFDCNTFYVTFLDANHLFYKTEKK
ncbi:MAG: hypothetical protein AABZ79_02115 [Pseudomonadota bacterium]|jgi:hypothetical protein